MELYVWVPVYQLLRPVVLPMYGIQVVQLLP
jgi:hypothetical protein